MPRVEGLTPKQEKFCLVYHQTANASEAYRQSYNVKNMSDECIAVEACKLKQNHNVSIRLEELKEIDRKACSVTVESLTKELEEARALAASLGQASAVTAAVMGKAKLHGLLIDKKNVQSEGTINVNVKNYKEKDGE